MSKARKQVPKFMVTNKYGDLPPTRSITDEYIEEFEGEDYSRKVMPLNRQAFKIAFKRICNREERMEKIEMSLKEVHKGVYREDSEHK